MQVEGDVWMRVHNDIQEGDGIVAISISSGPLGPLCACAAGCSGRSDHFGQCGIVYPYPYGTDSIKGAWATTG